VIYKTIHDIPIKILHRIRETGDCSLLIYETMSEAIKGKTDNEGDLNEIYSNMEYDLINRFGVSEKAQSFIYKQREILILEIEELAGDRSVSPMLAMMREQYEALKSELSVNKEIDKENARLRRIVEQEYSINIDRCTAFEFYTYLKDIEAKQQELKVSNLRKVS